MDALATEVEQQAVTTEQFSPRSLFNQVRDGLAARIKSNGEKNILHEIDASITTAIALAEKLDIEQKFLDPNDTQNVERAILLMGIAQTWSEESNEFSAARRKLSMQLATLYPDYMRHKKMYSKETTHGTKVKVVEKLIQHYFPESDGTIEWIKKNKNRVKEMGCLDWDERCIVFPAYAHEGHAVLAKVVAELGEDPANQVCFDGLADREDQLIFVWRGTSELSKTHEFTHIDNQGLRIGAYGSGLDEGMTQMKTFKEMNYPVPGYFARSGHMGVQYANELKLLYDVFSYDKELEKLFDDNYVKRTSETSYALFSKLISLFGLQGTLALYRVKPLDYQPALDLHEKHWGIVDKTKIPHPQPLTVEEYIKLKGYPPVYESELKTSYTELHPRVSQPNLSPVYLKAEEAADELELEKHFQYTSSTVYPK